MTFGNKMYQPSVVPSLPVQLIPLLVVTAAHNAFIFASCQFGSFFSNVRLNSKSVFKGALFFTFFQPADDFAGLWKRQAIVGSVYRVSIYINTPAGSGKNKTSLRK